MLNFFVKSLLFIRVSFLQDGAAVGLYDSRQTFNIDLSTDKVPGNGFIALGSDDYGYFDLHSYILKGPHYVV